MPFPGEPGTSRVAPAGPLATTSCEPRQARKGAAAAMDSGAGVWRAGVATIFRLQFAIVDLMNLAETP